MLKTVSNNSQVASSASQLRKMEEFSVQTDQIITQSSFQNGGRITNQSKVVSQFSPVKMRIVKQSRSPYKFDANAVQNCKSPLTTEYRNKFIRNPFVNSGNSYSQLPKLLVSREEGDQLRVRKQKANLLEVQPQLMKKNKSMCDLSKINPKIQFQKVENNLTTPKVKELVITSNSSKINKETPIDQSSSKSYITEFGNQNRYSRSLQKRGQIQLQKDCVSEQFQQFLSDNKEYLAHLSGKCSCINQDQIHTQCKFFQKQIRPQIPGFSQTHYQSNYKKLQPTEKETTIKMQFYEQKYDEQQCDLKSTNQVEFTSKQDFITKPKIKKEQYQFDPSPAGFSSYTHDYLNWGVVPYYAVKNPDQRTTNDKVKFNGSSLYKLEYAKINSPNPNSLPCFKQTFNPNKVKLPFLADTTMKTFYTHFQPQETQQVTQQAINRNAQLVVGVPSFKGQFESEAHKTYKSHQIIGTRFFVPQNKEQIILYQSIRSPSEMVTEISDKL